MGDLRRKRVEHRTGAGLEHSGADRKSRTHLRLRGGSPTTMALPERVGTPDGRRAAHAPQFFQADLMKGILLIDHGSTRDEANQMLVAMAALVQRVVGEAVLVRYAHMELAEPSIAQGFAA